MFFIDPDTGMMSTIGNLDYESKRYHQLKVRATDSLNGGYSEVTVLFEVEDVNDNKPFFEKSVYEIQVSEAAGVGSSLLKIHATDKDGPGDNSDIKFSLIRDANDTELSLFNIDSESGELTLRSYLDRERISQHSLTVMALDQGSRPLSSLAKIIVTVLDANDNAPSFEEPEYNVRLSDKAHRGQFVASVRAIDSDQVSDLTYGIVGGNEGQVFAMDPKEGIISLAFLNGFDQVSSYNLNLSVSDGVFSAFAKVKIGLVSANSYAPKFAQVYFQTSQRFVHKRN